VTWTEDFIEIFNYSVDKTGRMKNLWQENNVGNEKRRNNEKNGNNEKFHAVQKIHADRLR
jgi:hypothetical protein